MGTYSLKNVYNVLKDTNFFSDHIPYIFKKFNKNDFSKLHLEVSKHPDVYSEVINDKDELTVIIPKDLWDSQLSKVFTPLKSLSDIGLITCEIKGQSQGGFLHSLVTMLSTHSIGVYVQIAFTTDHIFVSFDQLEEALRLLNQLKG